MTMAGFLPFFPCFDMPITAALFCSSFHFTSEFACPHYTSQFFFVSSFYLPLARWLLLPPSPRRLEGQLLQQPPKRERGAQAIGRRPLPTLHGKSHLTRAEDAVTLKLDAIMKSVADLSIKMWDLYGHVQVTDAQHNEVEVSPASLYTSCPSRRRARLRGSPDHDQEVTEEVRR